MNIMDKFWNANIENLKKGYIEETEYFECLLCGKKLEKGIIYQDAEFFFEPEKYMKKHIEKAHRSVFEFLIGLDKKTTGISDHQNRLLQSFYVGKSDDEIQKDLGIGSSSTIRNHRFVLREKERQAKVFLVLMELLKEKGKRPDSNVVSHKSTKKSDIQNNSISKENDDLLKKYFPYGLEGPLKTLKMKEKNKLVVLKHLLNRFEENRRYTEKEVNEILKNAYEDFVTIRRYFIEYGFMVRKSDGSQYWLAPASEKREEIGVDRKKELIAQYKEMKKDAGVYQIKNLKNGKILVIATPDLKTMNGKMFQLKMGSFDFNCKPLQEDFKQHGEEAFTFEILEVLEEKEDGFFDKKDELKKLEKKWLEKLQPYGDKGYNKKKE